MWFSLDLNQELSPLALRCCALDRCATWEPKMSLSSKPIIRECSCRGPLRADILGSLVPHRDKTDPQGLTRTPGRTHTVHTHRARTDNLKGSKWQPGESTPLAVCLQGITVERRHLANWQTTSTEQNYCSIVMFHYSKDTDKDFYLNLIFRYCVLYKQVASLLIFLDISVIFQ
jgi:hypothetical protein